MNGAGLASTYVKCIMKERINVDQINRPTEANVFLGGSLIMFTTSHRALVLQTLVKRMKLSLPYNERSTLRSLLSRSLKTLAISISKSL